MQVAITVITHEGQSLWSNGIGQNVLHLAHLLDTIPFVESVVLLNCGNQTKFVPDAGVLFDQFPLVHFADIKDSVDVIVEMSGAIDPAWGHHIRPRGGRTAYMICGQPYSGLVEPTTFNKPSFFGRADRCDEIWVLPKDSAFVPMLRTMYRCPVAVVPYLWSPVFIDHLAKNLDMGGNVFGYPPGALESGSARIAIFEPNISTVKSGIIPMMIAEEVQRRRPDLIGHVHMLNSMHMIAQASFSFLAQGLDIHTNKKLTIGAREYFLPFMAAHAQIVICHQLDCDQNYLYLDALHAGYPLIHNSERFRHVGYFYPASDIQAGAEILISAIQNHDENLAEYQMNVAAEVARLNPKNPINYDVYARRLLAMCPVAGKVAA